MQLKSGSCIERTIYGPSIDLDRIDTLNHEDADAFGAKKSVDGESLSEDGSNSDISDTPKTVLFISVFFFVFATGPNFQLSFTDLVNVSRSYFFFQ